jgi:hypothetical protein
MAPKLGLSLLLLFFVATVGVAGEATTAALEALDLLFVFSLPSALFFFFFFSEALVLGAFLVLSFVVDLVALPLFVLERVVFLVIPPLDGVVFFTLLPLILFLARVDVVVAVELLGFVVCAVLGIVCGTVRQCDVRRVD